MSLVAPALSLSSSCPRFQAQIQFKVSLRFLFLFFSFYYIPNVRSNDLSQVPSGSGYDGIIAEERYSCVIISISACRNYRRLVSLFNDDDDIVFRQVETIAHTFN